MQTALEFALAPIRAGTVVRIYNEGLTGLLYDKSYEEALGEEAPGVLYGVGEDLHDDDATISALRSGRLLVFGMHGDGGIDMEVVVGDPLTEAELANGRWLQDGPCFVDVPGGQLCIHSYDSLPIGDFPPESVSPGGLVEVPPGRYHARLYRKQWWELRDDDAPEFSADEETRLSEEVISDVLVLTPFRAGEEWPDVHNVLFAECIGFEAREGVEAD